MRKAYPFGAAGRCSRIVLMLAMLAPGVVVRPAAGQAPHADAAAAREAIAEGNRVWGRARVAHDRTTFERMLGPEFYAQFPQGRMTRQEFIDMISGGMPALRYPLSDPSAANTSGNWRRSAPRRRPRGVPSGRAA